jgi:hypothetical protein
MQDCRFRIYVIHDITHHTHYILHTYTTNYSFIPHTHTHTRSHTSPHKHTHDHFITHSLTHTYRPLPLDIPTTKQVQADEFAPAFQLARSPGPHGRSMYMMCVCMCVCVCVYVRILARAVARAYPVSMCFCEVSPFSLTDSLFITFFHTHTLSLTYIHNLTHTYTFLYSHLLSQHTNTQTTVTSPKMPIRETRLQKCTLTCTHSRTTMRTSEMR